MLVLMFVCQYDWWTHSFDMRKHIPGCCVLNKKKHVYQAKYLYTTHHLILYLSKLSIRYFFISLGVYDLIHTQSLVKCHSVTSGNEPNGLDDFFDTNNFVRPSWVIKAKHAWFRFNHIKDMEIHIIVFLSTIKIWTVLQIIQGCETMYSN